MAIPCTYFSAVWSGGKSASSQRRGQGIPSSESGVRVAYWHLSPLSVTSGWQFAFSASVTLSPNENKSHPIYLRGGIMRKDEITGLEEPY